MCTSRGKAESLHKYMLRCYVGEGCPRLRAGALLTRSASVFLVYGVLNDWSEVRRQVFMLEKETLHLRIAS